MRLVRTRSGPWVGASRGHGRSGRGRRRGAGRSWSRAGRRERSERRSSLGRRRIEGRHGPLESEAEEQARLEARAGEEAVRTTAAELLAAHVATLQKWEYQVETIDLTAHWTKTMQAAAIRAMRDKINAPVDPDVRLLLQRAQGLLVRDVLQ